jgi:hypothetical protein
LVSVRIFCEYRLDMRNDEEEEEDEEEVEEDDVEDRDEVEEVVDAGNNSSPLSPVRWRSSVTGAFADTPPPVLASAEDAEAEADTEAEVGVGEVSAAAEEEPTPPPLTCIEVEFAPVPLLLLFDELLLRARRAALLTAAVTSSKTDSATDTALLPLILPPAVMREGSELVPVRVAESREESDEECGGGRAREGGEVGGGGGGGGDEVVVDAEAEVGVEVAADDDGPESFGVLLLVEEEGQYGAACPAEVVPVESAEGGDDQRE